MEIIDAQIHRPLPLTPWEDFDTYAGYRHSRTGGQESYKEGSLIKNTSSQIALAVSAELAVASMEAAGVDAAVIYSSFEFCGAAISRYPEKFAGVFDFRHTAELVGSAEDFIVDLRSRPGMLGVRLIPGAGGYDKYLAPLTEGLWEPMFAAAERSDIPVVMFIPLHLPLMQDIARNHPDLRLIVDHFGMPAPPNYPLTESIFDTLPDLIALAQFPNIAVKATSVPALALDPYPFTSLWPKLHQVIAAFGPERLMWGSDFQRVTGRVDISPRPTPRRLNYSELVNYLRYTTEVSEADKAMMFSTTLRHWLRWPKNDIAVGAPATVVSRPAAST